MQSLTASVIWTIRENPHYQMQFAHAPRAASRRPAYTNVIAEPIIVIAQEDLNSNAEMHVIEMTCRVLNSAIYSDQ